MGAPLDTFCTPIGVKDTKRIVKKEKRRKKEEEGERGAIMSVKSPEESLRVTATDC